jgi:hypothetical protein
MKEPEKKEAMAKRSNSFPSNSGKIIIPKAAA